MKILHVLPQFHYVNEHTIIGGYPSAVARLAISQAGSGNEVEIASRMPSGAPPEISGVSLAVLGSVDATSHRHPLRFLMQLLKYMRSCFGRGDIVHFHSGHAEYAVASLMVALVFRTKIHHTLYCPVQAGTRGMIQRAVLRMARLGGVVLSGMSRHICHTIPGPAVWTPPVIDSEYFKPDLAATDDVQILFVGNATPSKGLADLIPAFVDLVEGSDADSGLKLVVTTELARTSEPGEVQDVLGNLSNADAFARISWLSIVPDMKKLLAQSGIHVAPFRSTNGPSDYFMSTLEAMAMEKVCVVSDLPGMAEVIKDGENGFSFQAGDILDLGQALRRALQSDRLTIGGRARQFVVDNFGDRAVCATNSFYGAK